MTDLSRRELVALLGAAALGPRIGPGRRAPVQSAGVGFRVRTITAGTTLHDPGDHAPVDRALAFLARARQRFVAAGYEVQTVRVATQPLVAGVGPRERAAALPALQALDRAVTSANARLSIGPVPGADAAGDPVEFARWVAELIHTTRNLSCTVAVASPDGGVASGAAGAAAQAMLAIARATAGGIGNFNFAAAANVPAGTPFFPVAYHAGPDAFAVGLESPPLVAEACRAPHTLEEAKARLASLFEARLGAIAELAAGLAEPARRRYLGIDASPAPGKDASIGAAIEALTGLPFGSAGTLAGCAAITDVLKRLRVQTCGYSGLMLPVLEDPVLARRAAEGRYSVRELLLYSSVCGTGLDVIPLAGDVAVDRVAALIGDVAALAVKLAKPLSARLFPVPGKAVGDVAHFDDPFLTDCVVLRLE
jgi:uncharacterized protein (UPF0210 family)